MSSNPALPPELLPYLADAEVEVVSMTERGGKLVLQVTKDIANEVGLLTFTNVIRVNLASRFSVASIGCHQEPGADHQCVSSVPVERLYTFSESWGDSYFVVAEDVTYERLPANYANRRE